MGVITCATLIPAPQPDEETQKAGGLIAKLRSQVVPVTVVAITGAENTYANTQNLDDVRESGHIWEGNICLPFIADPTISSSHPLAARLQYQWRPADPVYSLCR
jgi:hypothetical protein